MQTLLKAIKDKENRIIPVSSFVIKLTVVAAACTYIYNKLFVKQDFAEIIIHYENLLTVVPFLLTLVVCILMVVNWGLEALKWQYILKRFEKISLLKAFQSVLSGVTVSIASPNRTGEFAGRVFHLNIIGKGQAAMLAIITSYSQLLVTIIVGLLSGIFLLLNNSGLFPVPHPGLIVAALFAVLIIFFIYLNLNNAHLFLKLNAFGKFISYFDILKQLQTKELTNIFILSLIRYFIFSLQFYILLIISGVKIDFITALTLISVVYFIMTFIPTTIISELPVRGSVAVAVIGLVSDNHLAIANASFILWIINLMIPALFGAIFFFKIKLFKSPAIA